MGEETIERRRNDVVVAAELARMTSELTHIRTTVDKIDNQLNGDNGMRLTVDRLEQHRARNIKLHWLWFAGLIAFIFQRIGDWWVK